MISHNGYLLSHFRISCIISMWCIILRLENFWGKFQWGYPTFETNYCDVNYLQMIFSPEYDNSCNRSRRVQNLIKSSLPNAKHLSILFWSRLENQNIVLICVHWPQLLGDLIIILLLVLFSQSSDHCLSKGPLWFSELLQLHGEGWAQGSWLEEAQPSMLQVVGGGSSLELMVSWLSWQAAPRRRSTEDRRCSEWGKGRWVKIGRQGKERG